jgi:hypothetical protein
VNHADKMNAISRGEYSPKAIFRVNVGGKARPLYSGPTHTQDFTAAVRAMVSFPVLTVDRWQDVAETYRCADNVGLAMVVEYRDAYA